MAQKIWAIDNLHAMLMYPNHYTPEAKEFWEKKFSSWKAPASNAEEAKINHTLAEVRDAIENHPPLKGWLRAIPQGSFHNNTNVPKESDADIRLMYTGRFIYDVRQAVTGIGHGLGFGTYIGPSDDYLKGEIHTAFVNKFGDTNVQFDCKCFEIHASKQRVDADIILAYPYRHFFPKPGEILQINSTHIEGIAFWNGREWIKNYPEQHHELSKAKNNNTGYRYKAVVRALKTFNLEMQEPLKSFFVEGLVYNCENALFGNSSIYEDVQAVCNKILRLFQNPQAKDTWVEPNHIKPLFEGHNRTVNDGAQLAYWAKQEMERTS